MYQCLNHATATRRFQKLHEEAEKHSMKVKRLTQQDEHPFFVARDYYTRSLVPQRPATAGSALSRKSQKGVKDFFSNEDADCVIYNRDTPLSYKAAMALAHGQDINRQHDDYVHPWDREKTKNDEKNHGLSHTWKYSMDNERIDPPPRGKFKTRKSKGGKGTTETAQDAMEGTTLARFLKPVVPKLEFSKTNIVGRQKRVNEASMKPAPWGLYDETPHRIYSPTSEQKPHYDKSRRRPGTAPASRTMDYKKKLTELEAKVEAEKSARRQLQSSIVLTREEISRRLQKRAQKKTMENDGYDQVTKAFFNDMMATKKSSTLMSEAQANYRHRSPSLMEKLNGKSSHRHNYKLDELAHHREEMMKLGIYQPKIQNA